MQSLMKHCIDVKHYTHSWKSLCRCEALHTLLKVTFPYLSCYPLLFPVSCPSSHLSSMPVLLPLFFFYSCPVSAFQASQPSWILIISSFLFCKKHIHLCFNQTHFLLLNIYHYIKLFVYLCLGVHDYVYGSEDNL